MAERRIQTVCLLILTGLAIAAAMFWFRSILIPLTLAVFLTYCLAPIIDYQIRRLRIPRPLAILTTGGIGVIILIMLGMVIASFANQLAENLSYYRERMQKFVVTVADRVDIDRFGYSIEDLNDLGEISATTTNAILSNMLGQMTSIGSNGILVVVFMIFMLLGRGERPENVGGWLEEVEAKTKKYILTMVFISILTGILVGVSLQVLGVQFAWVFGFFAFCLNFIPSIGSIIATLLPVPVIVLSETMGVPSKVLAIVIPGAIQFCIGNLVTPKVMGHSLHLHPVTVLASLVFFGLIWGVVGMFLATPITAILRLLLDRIDYTRPVALILAGRIHELRWDSQSGALTDETIPDS